MTNKQIKEAISKYAEDIKIQFVLNWEEDGLLAELNLEVDVDGELYKIEQLETGTDEHLRKYTDKLKKSHITKANKLKDVLEAHCKYAENIEINLNVCYL